MEHVLLVARPPAMARRPRAADDRQAGDRYRGKRAQNGRASDDPSDLFGESAVLNARQC
jgi:hypothetical protein